MELRVLRSFVTIAREGNITRAANLIHISQPALSRQLMDLEAELGVRLFIRGKRAITLTDEGLLLCRRAEELLEFAEKTKQEFSGKNRMVGGEIAVGCGELNASRLLPQLFKTFSESFPHVHYDLYTGSADQITERMDRGLLDIGLLLEPVDTDTYDFIRLDIPERWVILMPANSLLAQKERISAADLLPLPIIITKRAKVQNELASWFGSSFDKLHIFSYNNLSGNAAVLVESGLGYALVLEGSVCRYSPEKFCYRPLYPELRATSVLAWKKKQPFSFAVTKFIEHLQSYLGTMQKLHNIQ